MHFLLQLFKQQRAIYRRSEWVFPLQQLGCSPRPETASNTRKSRASPWACLDPFMLNYRDKRVTNASSLTPIAPFFNSPTHHPRALWIRRSSTSRLYDFATAKTWWTRVLKELQRLLVKKFLDFLLSYNFSTASKGSYQT